MLYIIGGISRAGKSTLSRMLLNKRKLPYLSTDWIVMGFTNGMPEFGIHDQMFPEDIAEKMWSFTGAMCENILWCKKDYVIEGEAMLPRQISELTARYPGRVKVCFIGYAEAEVTQKLKEIKDFSEGERDWLINKPDEYILRHVNYMISHSLKIREECKKYNLKYFDTSYDFTGTLERAVSYLTGDAGEY